MVTARPRYGGALFFRLSLPRWIVAPRELMARGVAAAVVLTLVACGSAPLVVLEQPVTVGRSGTPGLLTAICWLGWAFTSLLGS